MPQSPVHVQVRGDDRFVPRGGLAAQRPESGSPELAGPVALLAGTNLGLSGSIQHRAEAVSQTSPVPAWPGSRVAGEMGEVLFNPIRTLGQVSAPLLHR